VNRAGVAAPVLRGMTEADLDAVVAIEAISATSPWSRETFAQELGIPFSRALVAERGRGVVGYVVWWRVAEEVHLLTLAVAPEARRAGVGRALLRAVLHDGGEARAERVALEVAAGNAAALALYASAGFVEVGRRRGYYGSDRDAILMSRTMSSDDAPHKR
jgi:[ribosomal protein S18]-alanine N-acetyltransferase